MVSIEFTRPVFLWLIALLPLLFIAHYMFLFRTQSKAMRFANFETIKRIAGERFVTKNITILALRFFVFVFAIIALSGMIVSYEGQRNDYDYVLAIDISSSMLTNDIVPNRLEVAKSSSLNFLDALDSSSSVGLVTFSGVTYVRNPLDTDYLNMRVNIANLNVSRTSGTDLFGAIVTSSNMFKDDAKGKAIILFTDGSNTVSAFIDDSLNEVVDYAIKENLVIHAVGLGTENARVGYLPESFNLTSSVNKDALDALALATGGKVIYPTSVQDLNEFFSSIDEQSTTGQIPYYAEKSALLGMVILLSIEWILINLLFRRVA